MFTMSLASNDEAAGSSSHTATAVALLQKRVDDLSGQLSTVQHMVEDGLTEKTYVVEASRDRILKEIHVLLSQSKQDMQVSVQDCRVSLQQELRDFVQQQEQQQLKEFRDEIDSLREQTRLTDASLMDKAPAPNDNPDKLKDVMATIERIVQEQEYLRKLQESTNVEAMRAEIQSILADMGVPSSSEKYENMEYASKEPNTDKHDALAKEGEQHDDLVKDYRHDNIVNEQLEEPGESFKEDDNLKDPMNTQEVVDKIHMMEEHLQYDYPLKESMWDASVFLGMKVLGPGGSIFLGFLWLVNVLVQGVFCYICWKAFDSPDFDDDVIFGLKIWRWNSAHDVQNVNPLWPMSLATRICGSDTSLALSGQQASELDLTERYRPEKTPWVGELMCLLCVLCLWTSVWGDAKDVYKLLRGVFACVGKGTALQSTEEGLKIQSLGPFRTAFILLTVSLRTAAFANIGAVGTMWLSHTTSVGDLLLNALALELVLTVDELLFTNLAPVRAKALMGNTLPLPTPHKQMCIGLDVTALLGIFMLFGALPAIYASLIDDTVDMVKQADEALCGGVTNFAYNVDPLGIVYITDHMQAPSDPGFTKDDFDFTDLRIQALEDVIKGLPRAEWKYALYEPDLQELKGKHSKPFVLMREEINHQCTDLLVNGSSNNPLRAALQRAADNVNSDVMCSSSSLQPYCHQTGEKVRKSVQLATLLCPVSCGCVSPTGGTIRRQGCPESCESKLWEVVAGMETCADVDVVSTSWWATWMQEAAFFVQDEGILAQMARLGCQALVSHPAIESFCIGSSEWRELKPLALVCPETCGCRSQMTSFAIDPRLCPKFCRNVPCSREKCREMNGLNLNAQSGLVDEQGRICTCSTVINKEKGDCLQTDCAQLREEEACVASGCVMSYQMTQPMCSCPCNGNNFGPGCACGTNYCGGNEVRNHCFNHHGEEVTTNGTLCERPCVGSVENPVNRDCTCGSQSCSQDLGCEDEYTCGYPKCVIRDPSNTDNPTACKCGDKFCFYNTDGCYNDAGVSDELGSFCERPCVGSLDNPVDRKCFCGSVSCSQDLGCENEYTCRYPKCTGSVDNPVNRDCTCGSQSCSQDLGCEDEYTCNYPRCVIRDPSNTDSDTVCKCGDDFCYSHMDGCYNDAGVSDDDGRFCYPP